LARNLKSQQLVEGRRAHAQAYVDKWVTILPRPTDGDAGYIKAFSESILLKGCSLLKRNGLQRHAWLFDPGADMEPCLNSGQSVWRACSAVDEAACRPFFCAVAKHVLPGGAVGLSLYADGRGRNNLQCLYRLAGKGKFTNHDAEELNVIYKELPVRQGASVREDTHETFWGLVPGGTPSVGQFGSRLYFTQTGTNSNSIVMATTVSDTEAALVDLATKVLILGLDALLPREKEIFMLKQQQVGEAQGETQEKQKAGETQGEDVLLFHQEKSQQVSEEILHHFGVTSLCTTTPGSGEILRAAVCREIPVLAFSKNDAHNAWLKEGLCVWAVGNQK
jgi:hypothetical protein